MSSSQTGTPGSSGILRADVLSIYISSLPFSIQTMEAKGGGARGKGRAAGAFTCHSAGQLSELRSPFPQDEITEGFSQPTSVTALERKLFWCCYDAPWP